MKLAIKALLATAVLLSAFWGWVQYRAQAHESRAESSHPPQGRILQIQGHRVHAVISGKGPDLVLVHGASGNARDMTFSLAPRLARHFRVIAIDRPGLGYTDRINRSGATIVDQAGLLAATARELGADRPVVLGHSYGGAVALAWAVHHPGTLSALVTLAAPSNPWESDLSTYYKILSHPILGPLAIPLITAFIPDARVKTEIAAIFTPDPVPDGYTDHVGAGLTLRRHSLRANALQRARLLPQIKALHTRYDRIGVPTEIVHGTADTTVGLTIHSEPLSKQINGARLTRLEGVGHMPHHAAEDAIVEAVRRAARRAGLHAGP